MFQSFHCTLRVAPTSYSTDMHLLIRTTAAISSSPQAISDAHVICVIVAGLIRQDKASGITHNSALLTVLCSQ